MIKEKAIYENSHCNTFVSVSEEEIFKDSYRKKQRRVTGCCCKVPGRPRGNFTLSPEEDKRYFIPIYSEKTGFSERMRPAFHTWVSRANHLMQDGIAMARNLTAEEAGLDSLYLFQCVPLSEAPSHHPAP
ncbi:hypothetical protein DV515_00000224 [Chloebia gouldiae]|uniref:Uncharacterized protein n=1 Tax=Chloebia gouldiae TaxID=44316 RepID=A0A3L8T0Z7_CHLGU|nr:hypothetical protein DV515_00000224 [Chloebia gouldiae]